jgi:outer membrane protein assembly factor BamB
MPTFFRRLLLAAWLVATACPARPAQGNDCDDCGDRGCHAGTVADEFVADRVGLIREWAVRLPFGSTRGRVRHVSIGEGIVVATAEDGSMHAVAASGTASAAPRAAAAEPAAPATSRPAPGSILWSTRIGEAGVTALPIAIGGNTVTVGGDLGIVAVDADAGTVRWRENFGIPTAAAAPLGGSVYVPLSGGRIRRTLADPLKEGKTRQTTAPTKDDRGADEAGERRPRRGKRAAADKAVTRLATDAQLPEFVDSAGRLDRAVMSFENGIAWTTTNGMLVALERTADGWERHEFDLLSATIDAPLVRGKSIFVATVAGDLARVDMPAGPPRSLRTGWHTVLAGRPDAGPFLGGNTIVVSLGDDGLAAYAADTGRPVWRSPVAGTVLAVGGDRVWLIDHVGRLSAIDMTTGERRERLCLGCLTLPIVNSVNDRLYLASADGLLVGLVPKRSIPDAFPAPTPVKKQKPRPGRGPDAEQAEPEGEAAEADADR